VPQGNVSEDRMSEFVMIVDFEVQPGTADEVVKLVSENARQSVETEPGVLQFDVLRVADNPNRLVLYEVYENEAALQSHMKTPHLAAFLEKARPKFVKTTFTKTTRAAHPVKK
jgi:(4S)-4-hydroxy-5-phosphonooxypentane-2,3-dione isomerase